MKIIAPSVEIMRTGMETEFMTPEQFIEKVGRTCYKSEDKITEDSAVKFVGGLVKRGHEAMIEHWSLIFKVGPQVYEEMLLDWINLLTDGNFEDDDHMRPYIRFTDYMDFDDGEVRYIVSGNMRAWRDFTRATVRTNGIVPYYMWGMIRNYPTFFPEYQEYIPTNITNGVLTPISVNDLSASERRIHQDITMKFVCDRGVSHEMVRHRVASFAQESTRYCNYSGDKFGNEITVIRPSWCEYGSAKYAIWESGCMRAEESYFRLIDAECTPQEARSVLPNSLKTEIIVTMNLDGWNHFFDLRDASAAQPDMREVAKIAHDLYNGALYHV